MKFKLSIAKVLFLAAILSNSIAQAQEQEHKDETSIIAKKDFYYEQGLNASQFIKQYLSLNATLNTNIPYMLTGNIGYKNFGVRYGVNYVANNTSKDFPATSAFGSYSKSQVEENILSYRVGLFYSQNISKHWRVNYGVDYIAGKERVKATSSSFSNNSSSNQFISNTINKSESLSKVSTKGGGPFLAIHYFLNSKISLGTEASFYLIKNATSDVSNSYTTTTTTGFFGGSQTTQITNTENKINDSSKNKGTQLNVPLSIFIYFKF